MENNHPNNSSTENNMMDTPLVEEPIIIIEHTNEPDDSSSPPPAPPIRGRAGFCSTRSDAPSTPPRGGSWRGGAIALACALCIGAAALWGYWYYMTHVHIEVPISRTPQENIAILQQADSITPAELRAIKKSQRVVVSTDSILGVSMTFYELTGLYGEVVMEEPDTLDTDVMFYSRCADYQKNNRPIGSLVSRGQLLSDEPGPRLGYCGMVGPKCVVGVARDESVREHCMAAGGSYFRQFILVSAGELPSRFHLHGKVVRRALGRTSDDRLFFIQTDYPEVMTAFADALREYGFTDAIYITGGDGYCYYRSRSGQRHDIGDVSEYPYAQGAAVPWMVFRRK